MKEVLPPQVSSLHGPVMSIFSLQTIDAKGRTGPYQEPLVFIGLEFPCGVKLRKFL